MKRHIIHGNAKIEYHLVRSERRKTSELFVDAGKVLIRTPATKPVDEVDKIVKAKANWIIAKQEKYRKFLEEYSRPNYEEGSILLYLGHGYPVHVVTNYKEDKLRYTNSEFLITVKSKSPQKRTVRRLYEDWLEKQSVRILGEKVLQYSRIARVAPPTFKVKNLKKRWGSATKSKVLNFNANLLKAPEDVIDYIVLHEVCHLRIRNHSHHFWNLLKSYMPDYAKRANWLSTNANGLVE